MMEDVVWLCVIYLIAVKSDGTTSLKNDNKYRTVDVILTQWTWLAGESIVNQQSNISYLGDQNYPGSRTGNAYWSDKENFTWIFGGFGFDDDVGTKIAKPLNDLWRFNFINNSWTLLAEERVGWDHQGIDKINAEIPTVRHNAASCGLNKHFLVLYGGRSVNNTVLSDTWVYFFKNSTWVQLHILQVLPAARSGMVHWCLSDRMIIFSGVQENNDLLDDMWVLGYSSLLWKKFKIEKAVYTDSSVNHYFPLPRKDAVTWVTSNKTLYMFGGNTAKKLKDKHSSVGLTSDLWYFTEKTKSWTYVKGFVNSGHVAMYGSLGNGDSETMPGCRKSSLSWVDKDDNLWLFGGEGLDYIMPKYLHGEKYLSDLWKFDTHKKIWVWMGGLTRGRARYGKQHVTSAYNLPGPRMNAATWVRNGSFYLFGGRGHDSKGVEGVLNDMWVFQCAMEKYNPLVDVKFVLPFSPGILFIICFSGVLCVSFIMCLAVFVKKCLDLPYPSPARSPEKNYNVKYSPLNADGMDFS